MSLYSIPSMITLPVMLKEIKKATLKKENVSFFLALKKSHDIDRVTIFKSRCINKGHGVPRCGNGDVVSRDISGKFVNKVMFFKVFK